MKNYTASDVLRVAKRLNNTRRKFLLVNPLQGKHLPVSPTAALDMMNALGRQVAEKFPDARLVIGFAETATAIGAVVAKNLSNECIYLQTTRETFAGTFVEFLEEHSHAPEQKLYAENFAALLERTPSVVFVDDELSTGQTLLNIFSQLIEKFPALTDKKLCAASIISRLSPESQIAFGIVGIKPVALVELEPSTFDVEKFSVRPAQEVQCGMRNAQCVMKKFSADARRGVKIGEYFAQCEGVGKFVVDLLKSENISGEVLVLGTEEFMLPAIIAARSLERENFSVVTHSTTRSPIGISRDENYPVCEGYRLRSFYDATRTTFIYNLKFYDAAVIVTDAKFQIRDDSKRGESIQDFATSNRAIWMQRHVASAGADDLIAALNVHGVEKIFIVRC